MSTKINEKTQKAIEDLAKDFEVSLPFLKRLVEIILEAE